jgi:hypothetical protein
MQFIMASPNAEWFFLYLQKSSIVWLDLLIGLFGFQFLQSETESLGEKINMEPSNFNFNLVLILMIFILL